MRKNGILMHITSLPSPYGIGTMGQAAREFIEFLENGGQKCWQILPICPTGYGDSPYQSFSTYAGNPYWIDLDDLCELGLLEPEEYQNRFWGANPEAVDFGQIFTERFPVLRLAVERLWCSQSDLVEAFLEKEKAWLADYALFMALKEENKDASWLSWENDIRLRKPEALADAKVRLEKQIRFWVGVQYLFFTQWRKLKAYANEKGIQIIGDVPIYVALDSVDVWADTDQFQLDKETLMPLQVAGCPPDGFSADGQLWGNPLFRWDAMEQDGYQWWIRRIAYQCATYDILRIDHFRGFEAYYAIPFGDATARFGHWEKGPGLQFFQAVELALGKQNIIAEDLGFLTEEVREMLENTGFPGMKVLLFAFDSRDGGQYFVHTYPKNSVAYVGTHDNDTVYGWLETAPEQDVALAKKYLRLQEDEGYHMGAMRTLWVSASDLTIVQMQDVLGLGRESRMNTPGTMDCNWQWRMQPNQLTEELAKNLYDEMVIYSRLEWK